MRAYFSTVLFRTSKVLPLVCGMFALFTPLLIPSHTLAAPAQAHKASERFSTLPPGSSLPSEAECAWRVRRSSWESRPDNYNANHSVPTPQELAGLAPWYPTMTANPNANKLSSQITGNFTGTTDEIIQWVACKWGVDEDIVRAQAFTESGWHQHILTGISYDSSRCPPGTWNGRQCTQFYGLLQIAYSDFRSAWPMMYYNTAFAVEYAVGVIRNCYEGWTSYLHDYYPVWGYSGYHAGDLWGCIGVWYSGRWYSSDALSYISLVQRHLANRDWLNSWM